MSTHGEARGYSLQWGLESRVSSTTSWSRRRADGSTSQVLHRLYKTTPIAWPLEISHLSFLLSL